MSRVDTAWLRMDNDVNLMMIVGVWLLQPRLDYETLCERVTEKLLKYERFRQVVVRDAIGAAHWVDDDDFDIHHHVVREKLAARARAERARGAAGARAASWRRRRSIPARPLWQFHLIEQLRGRQRADRPHPPLHRRRHRADLGDDDDHRRRQRSAGAQARAAADADADGATGSPTRCSSRSAASRSRPPMLGRGEHRPRGRRAGRSAARARQLARHGARMAGQVLGDVAAMALMADDSPTLLKGKPSGRQARRLGRADAAGRR